MAMVAPPLIVSVVEAGRRGRFVIRGLLERGLVVVRPHMRGDRRELEWSRRQRMSEMPAPSRSCSREALEIDLVSDLRQHRFQC